MTFSLTALLGLVVLAGPAQPAPAVRRPATCERPWRTRVTALTALRADAEGVLLCADTQAVPGEQVPLPRPCARLDFATGAWADVSGPPPGTAAPPRRVEGLKVCVGEPCVELQVPEKDAAALQSEEVSVALNDQGTLAAVPLLAQRAVALFEVPSGKLVRTLPLPQGCGPKAFFLGEAVYVVSTACDATDTPTGAAVFVGSHRVSARRLFAMGDMMMPPAVTHLSGDVWAVASHKPYRVEALNGRTGALLWTKALPQLDEREGAPLALGLSVFGTVPADCSTLASTPSGAVVAVSSTGVVLFEGPPKQPRFWPFPDCGPR